jgi:hypothetical protein
MFRIFQQQIQAFQDGQLHAFQDDLLRHISSLWPERLRTAGATTLRGQIASLVEVALAHHIETEYGVCQFVELIMKLDEPRTATRHPGVVAVLTNEALPESTKIRALVALIAAFED